MATKTGLPEKGGVVLPFRRFERDEARPFENCVPLYDLKVAAGRFSGEQVVEAAPSEGDIGDVEEYDWVAFEGRTKPARDIFIAQVVGESMNRRIPNGAYCVWRLNPTGTRQGKVVLAQHRDIQDPEHGGTYTVKVYESAKQVDEHGDARNVRIVLRPDSDEPSFSPIVVEELEDDELSIVAELLEVL